MGEIKQGHYGWYYTYTDENGKSSGIKILDDVYDKYVSKGYLTSQHIDDMLMGKIISFSVPNKSGGTNSITAKIIPYTTKNGKATKILSFETDKIPDRKIIEANAEKIALSYWDGSNFNYNKPQEVVNTLDLDGKWKTFSTSPALGVPKKRYGKIQIYKSRSNKDNEILLYIEVDTTKSEARYVTEEEFKKIVKKIEEEWDAEQEKRQKERDILTAHRTALNNWSNDFCKKLLNKNVDEIIAIIKEEQPNLDVADLVSSKLIGGYGVSASYAFNFKLSPKLDRFQKRLNVLSVEEITNPAVVEELKTKWLMDLLVDAECERVINVRKNLYKRVYEQGIESVTQEVNIDTALDLGYFRQVQKLLVKTKQEEAIKAIIHKSYLSIVDTAELEEKLLNLLKVFHDFYDMPEKDRKAIAKFIAVHKLKDYYEAISKYDDVVEVLFENSRDPKLLKPILTGIAGTSKADMLKESTYYFERRGRIKDGIIVNKPLELVENLRQCIPEYNNASDVAILVNITLDADESFIFQFYTFSNEGKGEDFDGRRTLYLTKLYNARHPKDRIGFVF